MENFFYEDKFYSDLESFASDFEDMLQETADDEVFTLSSTSLEPIFQLDAASLSELLCDCHDDRRSEDGDEAETLTAALKKCVDFDKLNALIPKLHFINGESATITAKELKEYLS